MAAILIVGLPRSNSGMLANGLSEFSYDLSCFRPITEVGETIVTPRPEFSWLALGVDGQHIRHSIYQPFWWCRGWSAEHHGQLALCRQIKHLLQPTKLVFARRRLQAAPSKFSDPDVPQAEVPHRA